MATTVDSGNETLFSDDSPCELVRSPSACSIDDCEIIRPEICRPPNIQPFSGVLEKGKVVIRPIAFKPAGMTPAARFGLDGERYGSTPVLNRSGNDHRRRINNINNYSLDRKLRSSSSTSSPPVAMSSLTSLPHNLINYDSLESVRKSPVSTLDGTITNQSSYRLSRAGGGSLLDLTPSPSDSGVSELEAALRDRDSELAYLRQTMEHNEQVIFRVYQEKERVWERELRRMKTVQESRLRASAQRAMKLEQMLMMQTYQLQQDKKRLCSEAQRANCQNDRLRQEIVMLRGRLEETEWSLCQKTGEISLLKSQVKDHQNEHTAKGHEILQLRNECREARQNLDKRDIENSELEKTIEEKDEEINKLRTQLQKTSRAEESDKSFLFVPVDESEEDYEIRRLNSGCNNCFEFQKLKEELGRKTTNFQEERVIWAQEKEKVLKYQRQLQMNYIQMYRRTRVLEAEVESLTIELELDKTGIKSGHSSLDSSQTIEL